MRRDSLGEGLKAKRRSRRKGAARHADADKGIGRFRRNDIIPSLRIEPCPIDALKLHDRKLRKNEPAHVREIANAISTLGFNVPLLIGKNDVVIDGGSSDGTIDVLSGHADSIDTMVSEPDQGIYDALNKGVRLAGGDVVGILHSDDEFADPFVITDVVDCFHREQADVVYGDLRYISYRNGNKKTVRHWKSGAFTSGRLRLGWMPPHPAVFVHQSQVNVFQTLPDAQAC